MFRSSTFPSAWVDRQVDDALLMVSTATGTVYARRQARRHLPKVIVGGAVLAAVGMAAAAAATGIGILGAGGAGVAWYRYRKNAPSPTGWQTPPAPVAANSSEAKNTAASVSAAK